MGKNKNLNQTTAQLALSRKYVDEATLQDCLLELELVDNSNLLDLLYSKGLVAVKDYQDLKIALKLSETNFRGEQEEILLAKLLQDAQMVDQITLEKAFLKQEKFKNQGISKRLSEILVEMKVIEEENLKEASHMIQHMEVRCEKCQKKFPLKGLDRENSLQCPHCTFILLPDTHNLDFSDMMATMAPSTPPPASSAILLPDTHNLDFSDMMATMAPSTPPPASSASMGGEATLEQFDTISESEMSASETATTGDRFIGRKLGECRLVKKLGQGGMGAVYLGENLKLSRREAIKVLTSDVAASPEQLIRFQREARAAGTLDSPHIVRVLNIGEDQGIHYISMEYVEGKSLQDMINDQEKLSVVASINYIKQSAQGLMAAHEKGIIHRDIKPDNLMVHKSGIVKVADFGLARKIEDTMGITQSGAIMGTPYYMSPEQAGGNPTDHRSDIYSLGATFYYMLTGQQPFTGETPMAILLKHMDAEVVPPHQVEPSIPLSISNVIEKMMEKDPQYRYQSLQEFVEDLQRIEEGEEIGISEGKKKRILRKRIRRLVSTLLVLILVGGVYLLASGRQKSLEEIKAEYQRDLKTVQDLYQKTLEAKDNEKWTLVAQKLQIALEREDYNKRGVNITETKKLRYVVQIHIGQSSFEKAKDLKDPREITKLYDQAYEDYQKAQALDKQYALGSAEKEKLKKALEELSRGFLKMGWFFLEKAKDLKNTKEMLEKAKTVFKNVTITDEYKRLDEALKKALDKEAVQKILESLAQKLDPNLKLEDLHHKKLSILLRDLSDASLKDIPEFLKKAQDQNPSPEQNKIIQIFNKTWADELKLRQQEQENLADFQTTLRDLQKEKLDKIKELDKDFNQEASKIPLEEVSNLIKKLKDFATTIQKKSSLLKGEKEYAQKYWEKVSTLQKGFGAEKKDVEGLFKNYTLKKNFIGHCQKFFRDFTNPQYKKGDNLFERIKGREQTLLKETKKAYNDPSLYVEEIHKFREKACNDIVEVVYKRAKECCQVKKTQPEAEELLKEILQYKKEVRAEELLVEIRTPDDFIYIPGGNYSLGSVKKLMENRKRKVAIPDSFYIAQYELSNAQYSQFVLAGGYYQKDKYWSQGWDLFHGSKALYKPWPEGWDKLLQVKGQKVSFLIPPQEDWKNLPVTGVSFYEAQAYCKWLSEKLSREQNKKIIVRLPSAIEWEATAGYTGGEPRIYPWGNEFKIEHQKSFGQEFPRSVKEFFHDYNQLPCFNMGSNVSEWVILSSTDYSCEGVRGASFESTNPIEEAKCSFAGFKKTQGKYRFEDVGFRTCIETDAYKVP